MDRLLTSLERRFGRLAPTGLTLYLVGLQGLVYLVLMVRPDFAQALVLSPEALAGGEVWRLVTFLFLPWQVGGGVLGPVWTFFALMLLHTIGTALEQAWGAFRFDAFLLVGILATVASSLFFGSVTNEYLLTSMWLAFAVEFPAYEILLFFVLPVKMQWLGLLSGAFLVYQLVMAPLPAKAGVLVAMGAFLLFCGGTLLSRLRGQRRVQARGAALQRFRDIAAPPKRERVCARCGKSERDDPKLEFRVCSCEVKCGGKLTEYCLEHARSH
jgi:hypothetical protein